MKKLVKTIYNTTIKNGGASYNLKGKSPSKGFMVADFGTEEKIPVKEFTKERIHKYILNHRKQLKGKCFGTWLNDGYVYLDISKNIHDKEKAMIQGKQNKQLAIFDLSSFESINL